MDGKLLDREGEKDSLPECISHKWNVVGFGIGTFYVPATLLAW